jgi:ATP-dependent DNA helicase RecG
MLIALDNGFQALMMAPTEILAQQHYQSIQSTIEGMGIQVELLTGSVKGKQRKKVLKGLEEGTIQIVVGTHALIEDTVNFHRLGMVIIDEQHRFGVAQRAKLWKKGMEGAPHILVMTATPIPRTLAMTIYGDLDVSVIDELPPGRQPIKTIHQYETQRLRMFGFMKEQIKQGRQVYIVYPLIEESEHEMLEDINNLMAGYEAICREFPIPDYQVSVVHGKLPPANKDFEMQRFIKGQTHIMVATTVIEVGVNVPNATLMIIENAERFGLAQLHQLRGRVGRGAGQSYCILMTSFKLSADSRFRIDTMVETTDGFRIAEADLKLRGPGNMSGTEQSGMLNLRIADLIRDGHILQAAREDAMTILDTDPNLLNPENLPIKRYLENQQKNTVWSRIS